ncbi:MAG: hypothetical protein HY516_02200 [Candidatus Aenigmarchaeota archaeon]|nr:hypothetical protein [Candidatus Aenigmarchaeota archaeon]
MKLQKQLSRKAGNVVYPKWVIVISPKDIDKLGWKEGVELESETTQNKLLLKPKKN